MIIEKAGLRFRYETTRELGSQSLVESRRERENISGIHVYALGERNGLLVGELWTLRSRLKTMLPRGLQS